MRKLKRNSEFAHTDAPESALFNDSLKPLTLLAIAQMEGEDAKITGMTRSLGRRLLGLNMPLQRMPSQRFSKPLTLNQRIA
jgi:hypothetical protein